VLLNSTSAEPMHKQRLRSWRLRCKRNEEMHRLPRSTAMRATAGSPQQRIELGGTGDAKAQ
jgi:hypothetical protein